MRRVLAVACAIALVGVLGAPAGAGARTTRLGDDPAGDAPPALDIRYLDVGRMGKSIEIRIGVDGMLPVLGGYPTLPGIEWVFQAGERVFVAEAVANVEGPHFYLFEVIGPSFRQLEDLHGTYNPADGYIAMHVPLKSVGARKGMVLTGVTLDDSADGDVDAHVHAGTTYYADFLKTTASYTIP